MKLGQWKFALVNEGDKAIYTSRKGYDQCVDAQDAAFDVTTAHGYQISEAVVLKSDPKRQRRACPESMKGEWR